MGCREGGMQGRQDTEKVSLQLPELCSHVAVTVIALKTKSSPNIEDTPESPLFQENTHHCWVSPAGSQEQDPSFNCRSAACGQICFALLQSRPPVPGKSHTKSRGGFQPSGCWENRSAGFRKVGMDAVGWQPHLSTHSQQLPPQLVTSLAPVTQPSCATAGLQEGLSP